MPLLRNVLACISVAAFAAACHPPLPPVEEGDVVFQTSMSSQSEAIQQATHSRYSHMGVVITHGGEPTVFEASAKVRYTPLRQWIARGLNGNYVVKRLASGLTAQQAEKLRVTAREFEGRPYDTTFEWSDQRIYCSELVWKLYDRALGVHIGELQHLRDFDLSGEAVHAKIQERFKGNVPLDELVISPATMFDAKLLKVVASKGT